MDLTTAYDHPAVLLSGYAENARTSEDQYGMQVGASAAFDAASAMLRQYERKEKVTFAALDNDALAEVERLRTKLGRIEDFYEAGQTCADLETALDRLLGEVEA